MISQVKIIFENQDFMCVDKPQGLVVHGDGRTEEKSLVDFLIDFFLRNNLNLKNVGNPHTLDSGRYVSRWGVVNRLDRDTAGLILVAKNQNTFDELQKLFNGTTPLSLGEGPGERVIKTYLALVWGRPDFTEKIVTEKITRHKKDPRIWTCGFTEEEGGRKTGRDAKTVIQVKNHPFCEGKNMTQLLLIPQTGRTHQLRLHCRFIGHPIVGDDKYGINGKINEHSTRQIKDLMTTESLETDKKQKLKLIAKSLEFELDGTKYFFESGFEL